MPKMAVHGHFPLGSEQAVKEKRHEKQCRKSAHIPLTLFCLSLRLFCESATTYRVHCGWDEFEIKYASLNPYLQYFIGFSGYQEEATFDASTLALFRKRISAEMLMEVNEHLLAHKDDDNNNTLPSKGNFNDTGIADTQAGMALDFDMPLVK